MGLRDILSGRAKLKEPAGERLFALTTAAVTLDVECGLKPAGAGAVVFKPLSAGEFTQVDQDVEQLLEGVASGFGSKLDRQLAQISSQGQVDDELAKLKAELGPGDQPKEIEAGAEEAKQS